MTGYCNICGSNVKEWGYCGNDIKTKYSIIGNGKRIGLCPHCYSYDRGRWFYFVLKNFTPIFERYRGGRNPAFRSGKTD